MLDHPLLRRIGNVYTLVALGGLVIGALKSLGVLTLVGADPIGVGVIAVSLALLAFGLIRGGKKSSSPAADGDEEDKSSLPEPEAPTGVLADVEHREGCPRNPARMETYPKVRERDGIEVVVGHCLDCGVTAYRHGDRARASIPTAGTFDPELHALLSHGRGITDDHLLGGGLPSMNRAQRDESHRWTRDTASVLKARDPALAKHFLAAQSHRARLSVLADILGVDEP